MEIKIDIKNCSHCPHFRSSPYPTPDSFERPEYWWCMDDDAIASNETAEVHRQSILSQFQKHDRVVKLRYIAGYVEWNDKTPIPKWCPNKI